MSLFTLQTEDQQQYGPVELQTLRAWAREGRIERHHSIYDHTRLKWIEACKLPQIMDFFQSQTDTSATEALSGAAVSLQEKLKSHKETDPSHLSSPQTTSNYNPTRPPSVLDHISRIFINPLIKEKENLSKKKFHKLKRKLLSAFQRKS